jgi:hypothetical protein
MVCDSLEPTAPLQLWSAPLAVVPPAVTPLTPGTTASTARDGLNLAEQALECEVTLKAAPSRARPALGLPSHDSGIASRSGLA